MRNNFLNSKNEIFFIFSFIKNNFFNNNFFFIKNNKTYTFFNFMNFYKFIFNTFFWLKIRVLYYVNNWIYTTNHKRIAVNYFWFVILSGIVGMVLATLIRLEFAYPGVGIFAGDSLQYLSMATAHGVIMVFFMIMPLLLGAFANFLIPTQLGVHDVAFPRLNSAAFWFLPGGLLMLCQLVCVDRRYQRMNCFNIREIQSILKRKFFTDLINTHDHKTLLDKTAMGLRFKTNNLNSINSNIFTFYNYGIEFSPKIRTSSYFINNSLIDYNFSFNSIFFLLIDFFKNNNSLNFFNNFFFLISNNTLYLSNFNLNFKELYLLFYDYISETWYSANEDINNFQNSYYEIFSIFTSSTSRSWLVDSLRTLLIFPFGNESASFLFSINRNRNAYNVDLEFIQNLTQLIFDTSDYYLLNYFYNLNLNINYFTLDLNNIFYEFLFINNFLENFNFFSYNYSYKPNLDPVTSFKILPIYSKNNNYFNYAKNNNYSRLYENSLFNFENNLLSNMRYGSKFKIKTTRIETLFNFDYSSYFVYFYVMFYYIITLFNLLADFFKNFLNLNALFKTLFNAYKTVANDYIPLLLHINFNYVYYSNFFNSSTFNSYSNLNFYTTYSNIYTYYSLFFFDLKILSVLFNFFLILNSTIINCLSILPDFINNFALFSDKTNSVFSFFYDAFSTNSLKNFKNITESRINQNYSSNFFTNSDEVFNVKHSNEETSNTFRYLKFYNPVFKYDYKSGDYFPKLYKESYNYLFTSLNDLTNSVRTAPWYISDSYREYFKINFSNFYENITKTKKFSNFTSYEWSFSRFNNTDAFYNFFYTMSNDFNYTNKKWISLDSLNQKFYRMFNTSSMQQRIYSNWRQLKFTREAWRCKLLAARHQKTLFKRYAHEDGVFWSIERNAKDLLPGWAMITPFSSRTRFTAVGKTDIGLMGVFLVLNSSIISAANFLVTYRYLSTLNNRKMRDARVFFTESIIVSNWMMIFANPMLAIAILMLLSDRHWQTSFFDYSGGGDTVLFQHMFWFFGHPEVYIIIIPTFGFVNSILSYYLRKRVSARASLMYSMYTIAFLGFFVWGHHMYMVGLSHTTRMLFSTLTVMISVPAATKIMHWSVTTVNSSIAMELPLIFAFTFIFLFVSGGISGMAVAHTGMDILFHDTFYVVAHFHVMLAGAAMFASFGGFYFYFPAIFGVKYSRIYAYLHYSYYLIGQLMTVIPMFWLGYAGMPRRVLDYPASMGGWHSVISAGHMLSVAGLMAFFIMIFDSLRQGRAVTRNTFGIGRYNTRLNFYLYEISRTNQIYQKSLFLFRFIKPTAIKLNNVTYLNYEPLETTLITYTFLKK